MKRKDDRLPPNPSKWVYPPNPNEGPRLTIQAAVIDGFATILGAEPTQSTLFVSEVEMPSLEQLPEPQSIRTSQERAEHIHQHYQRVMQRVGRALDYAIVRVEAG